MRREGEYIHVLMKLILNQLNLFGSEQSKDQEQSRMIEGLLARSWKCF